MRVRPVYLALIFALTAPLLRAQANRNAAADNEVHVLPVQGSVYMLVAGGSNVTVHAGDDGVLLVDAGNAAMSDKILAAVHAINTGSLNYIVNTNENPEHTGGNAKIALTGTPVGFHNLTGPGRGDAQGAFIIAYQTTFERMSAPTGGQAAASEDAWPNDTYSIPTKNLYFNGEAIQIMHQPANTDGNSIVLFRKSDVISAGDILDLTEYPIIDIKAGGSIQAEKQALDRLIEMAVVKSHSEGGTMIIPGRGRLCDQADVVVYDQMVTVISDRIRNYISQGMTLEQVKAAKPTADWDPLYGKTSGPWTTDMFVEAAYRSLSAKSGK
jgi:glyoxylase-like metal-dependent hydrolase (beta-lactamase superfamily II)